MQLYLFSGLPIDSFKSRGFTVRTVRTVKPRDICKMASSCEERNLSGNSKEYVTLESDLRIMRAEW